MASNQADRDPRLRSASPAWWAAAAAERERLASRTNVDDPDEPTIVVPRPSASSPEAPAEVEEPADAQPEAPAAVQEPSGVPSGPPAAQEPSAGQIPREPPGFLPRTDLLTELDRPGARVLVLRGVSGAGATQLAAAYARARLAQGWRLVAWVSARDTGSLLGGLAAVADTLGLPEPGATQARTDPGKMVRRWLETDGERCLLVLDDVTDPEVVRPFIPAAGAARVVITSRQEPDLGPSVPVGGFSADEALAFLAERTGLTDEAAAAVAAELGHLPLPLALAAALIAAGNLGYDAYLDRLRALPAGDDQADPARAVRLCLDAVPDGVGRRVMELISVLSGAGVRRDLLYSAASAGILGERLPSAAVDAALDQLASLSLLTFSLDGQTAIASSLVPGVVRAGLSARRLAEVCRNAAALLHAHAQASADAPDRLAVSDISEQLTALAQVAGSVSQTDQGLIMLLLQLRFLALYHLIELGDSAAQAIAVGEPLTADLEQALGPDHPDTLNARNSLAAAYQAAGRPAEAIPLFEQTLAVRGRLLGPDHPDTLTTQNNLAAAYQDAGRADEAIRLLEQTLDGRENVLGANHPDTVNSRINLVAAYREAGRVAEAIPLVEYILVAREQQLGADHPSTMSARNNLAAAYREAGRVAEAIPLVEYILAVREQQLGADHPRTLGSRNNLANAYRDVGRVDEAIVLHEQTLAACERQFGTDHARTLSSRSNLAASYQDASRVDEAIPLLEQTLADRERLLGADHPSTLNSRHNLATAYRDAGRVDEAIPLLEQTLADRERVLGADHPDTVTTRKYLALTDQHAVRAGEG